MAASPVRLWKSRAQSTTTCFSIQYKPQLHRGSATPCDVETPRTIVGHHRKQTRPATENSFTSRTPVRSYHSPHSLLALENVPVAFCFIRLIFTLSVGFCFCFRLCCCSLSTRKNYCFTILVEKEKTNKKSSHKSYYSYRPTIFSIFSLSSLNKPIHH